MPLRRTRRSATCCSPSPIWRARPVSIPKPPCANANSKFTRRFHHVEARCREDGLDPKAAGLDRLDGYWNEIRAADKA